MSNTPLPSWLIGIRKTIDLLTNLLNVFGTLLIVAVMALINADVIGRVFFAAPVSSFSQGAPNPHRSCH